MDRTLTLIFAKYEITKDIISWPKFQHFYNYERNEISPNLEGVAQKVCLLRPFEVLYIFGGKSISFAPRTFKFSEKWVSIKMYKWWNFGVDISNHFWLIGQKTTLTFKALPPLVQIGSKWTRGGGNLKVKISFCPINQKWLEILLRCESNFFGKLLKLFADKGRKL